MTSNQTETIFQSLERLVRETGYNVAVFATAKQFGEDYSRAMTIYQDSCYLLLEYGRIHGASERAESFIGRTYGPERVAV